jgi:6-phosphofructokinase 2
MADVLTVTLNPALDVSASTPGVRPTSKLRCDEVQRHPGGGGINVARVLHRLGVDCIAVGLLGGPSGKMVSQVLEEEGVSGLPVAIGGHTRESFHIRDTRDRQEYRFVLPGPEIHAQELDALMGVLALQPPPLFVVVSGSVPPGVPADFYARLAQTARAWGARLVLDGSGPPLEAGLGKGVYLVKPSLREIREVTGLELGNLAAVRDAAFAWIAARKAEVVVVSLGERGALLVGRSQVLFSPAMAVTVVSAVGAGDSFVAGMVCRLVQGTEMADAFRHGVAVASAALKSSGTGLCAVEDVMRLLPQVVVREPSVDELNFPLDDKSS